MRLLWTKAAASDLQSIREYISAEKSKAAKAIVVKILETANRLPTYPGLGRFGRVTGTREINLPEIPFILIYRDHPDRIEILRILHSPRKWPE